jgi:hypothetical protein
MELMELNGAGIEEQKLPHCEVGNFLASDVSMLHVRELATEVYK